MPRSYPDADISTGLWTPTPVWQEIDEINDTEFVTSRLLSLPDQFVVHLEDFDDPLTDNDFTMALRATKDATGGQVLTLDWILKEGATTIKSDSWTLANLTTWQTRVIPLSEAEVAAITDFTDLRFDVTASGTAVMPRRRAKVTQAHLTVPNKIVMRLHDCTLHDCTFYGE